MSEGFSLRLTDSDTPFISIRKEGGIYLIQVIEKYGDNEQIAWQDTQKKPFWKSEKRKKETWRILHEVVPLLTEEKYNEITTELANADEIGDIPSKVAEKKEEEQPTLVCPSFVFNSENIIMLEEVYDPTDKFVGFAIWDGEKVNIADSYERDGVLYLPRMDDGVTKGIIMFPTKAEEFESITKLIGEIKEFCKKYLDVSEDFLEIACWYVLLSWLYDRVSTLAYLRTMGDWGTGKSRFQDVFGGLCYRGMRAGGATSSAAVSRLIELWGGTLILNEADWEKSDEKQDIVKILNEGFEKRGAIIKAHQDKQKELIYYGSYGPKILATRGTFEDPALESRCLTEVMEETRRKDILPVLTKPFFEEQLTLRNKLLMFRFKTWRDIKEEAIDLVFPKLMSAGLEKRLIQGTITFSTLFSSDEQLFTHFLEFLKKYQRELKETRALSMEGMIINAIYKLLTDGTTEITPTTISNAMPEVGWSGDPPYPGTIGKHLRALKIATKLSRMDGKPSRFILWNEEQLTRFICLAEKYVPDLTDVTVDTLVTLVSDRYGLVVNTQSLLSATPSTQHAIERYHIDTTVTPVTLLQKQEANKTVTTVTTVAPRQEKETVTTVTESFSLEILINILKDFDIVSKAKLVELTGLVLENLQSFIDILSSRGAVIDRGSLVEVIR